VPDLDIQEAIVSVMTEGEWIRQADIAAQIPSFGADQVRGAMRRLLGNGIVEQAKRRGPYRLLNEADRIALQKATRLSDTGTGGPSFHSGEGDVRAVRKEESGNGNGALVHVPLAQVTASAGPGDEPFTEEVARYLTYDRAQLRRETGVAPDSLAIIIATGDSMQPVIQPGDRLLVATHGDLPIIDGAIYIWRHTLGLVVKRARLRNACLYIIGEADTEPVGKIAPGDDSPDFQAIGRVLRVEKPL
jgi:phage repressor protein C with HTH and peptisase S24 domain